VIAVTSACDLDLVKHAVAHGVGAYLIMPPSVNRSNATTTRTHPP
jgi:response regulator of citrate/malate metabolism